MNRLSKALNETQSGIEADGMIDIIIIYRHRRQLLVHNTVRRFTADVVKDKELASAVG
jgi:hypothetical protein